MKKTGRILTLMIGLILTMLFCGCVKSRQVEEQEENNAITSYDWKERGFSANEKVNVNESLFLGKYNKWDHNLENWDGIHYVDSGAKGDFFWYLAAYKDSTGKRTAGSGGTYLLETYQVSQGKIDEKVFKARDVGAEGDLGYLVGMDYIDDGKYMFRWAKYEQNDEGLYRQSEDDVIITDLNGNYSVVDFKRQFTEDQLEEYAERELPMMPYVKCRTCGNREIWVLSSSVAGSQKICIYEQNGERILEKVATGSQYFMQPFLDQDECLILPVRNTESNDICLLWFDPDTKNMKELGHVNDEKYDIVRFCGMDQNTIYYEAADPEAGTRMGIVQWNVGTGDRNWMLGLDVSNYLQYKTWWLLSEGKIVSGFLMWEEYRNTDDWIVSVTDKQDSGEGDIRIADLTGSSEKLKKCASSASMNNPGITYRYEDVSSDGKKNIINAELSKNEGPDIMFVSMKDFYNLDEKGLLLDLKDMVSRKTLDNLLPGVPEIGRTGNGLMGIPIGLHVETMMVGKGVGKVSQWNLEVVTDLMKRGLLNTSIWSPYVMNSYLEPASTVQLLINYSMNNSFLIDWGTKTCHFDDDRFVQLLETTKTDGSKQVRSEDAKNDLTWVYLNSYLNLIDFMARASDEGEIVGFPGQYKNGGFLVADQGVLVVNKNVKDKDAVRWFIEKILSKEIQNQQEDNPQISILKFEPKDYITTDHDGNRYYFNTFLVDKIDEMDEQSNPILLADAFLNDCLPAPKAYYEIRTIIAEELQSFYAKEKDAKSVADVINNRVQIYLSEQ
ncbi:MAG: extracellular solute-binding protein [Lachnospiraceae bacterium]|nr:extracellular solute-binding protein [Lachnospiraceae bacterium]